MPQQILGLEYKNIRGKLKDMYLMFDGKNCYQLKPQRVKPLGARKRFKGIEVEMSEELCQ